jgi:hypothetical protein
LSAMLRTPDICPACAGVRTFVRRLRTCEHLSGRFPEELLFPPAADLFARRTRLGSRFPREQAQVQRGKGIYVNRAARMAGPTDVSSPPARLDICPRCPAMRTFVHPVLRPPRDPKAASRPNSVTRHLATRDAVARVSRGWTPPTGGPNSPSASGSSCARSGVAAGPGPARGRSRS